jgi:carboxyl-terminal processing protease
MKGIPIALAVVLSCTSMTCGAANDGSDTVDLHAVEATVGQLLEQDHYTQRKLDPNLAKQILETYLESLDYNRLFFTEEDVDQIRSEYGSGLDEDILLGNLTPARNIYEIFRRRVDQRVAKINLLLNCHYHFNSNRTITANRAQEPWPTNASVADGIWRDWIERELLQERLNAGPAEPGPEALGRRYRALQNAIDHQDDEQLLGLFLEAVAQTYDPHSEYLGPYELNEFKIDTQLTISGIGVRVRMENGYATIDRIFPGGAAERSGNLQVGDMIVGVAQGDGPFVSTVHKEMNRFTEMVLGNNGSVVRLQVISGKKEDPSRRRTVRLIRREVRLTEQEAQAQLIERPVAGGITQKLGWITVPSFYGESDNSIDAPSVANDVAMLIKRLAQEGIQGLVVDLRNNAGGSVEEAVRMSGLFVSSGPIAQLKDPNGAILLVKGQPGKALYNGPMVVLENKLTASASEIFSAAMQDYGRAVIVGDSSSFGKGTVQILIELGGLLYGHDDPADSAGALKITMQKIYRVTGKSTQLKGVVSDVTIPSLTDSPEFGESENGHPLADDDEVAPTAIDAAGDYKPLFLDKLRSRSIKRISEDPLFHDLSAEIRLIKQKLSNNCLSLNAEVCRNELAAEASLRKKADSDRIIATAHDRTKQYRLTLADVDKRELKLIDQKAELGTARRPAVSVEPAEVLNSLLPGKSDFGTATENDGITRETLNILTDLVSLKRNRLMATRAEDSPPGQAYGM